MSLIYFDTGIIGPTKVYISHGGLLYQDLQVYLKVGFSFIASKPRVVDNFYYFIDSIAYLFIFS